MFHPDKSKHPRATQARLETLRSHLKAALSEQEWKTALLRAPFPSDLRSANLHGKLVDAVLDGVLVPLLQTLNSEAIESYLLVRPDWCQESPDVAASRAQLEMRMNDIDVAQRASADVATAAESGSSSHC